MSTKKPTSKKKVNARDEDKLSAKELNKAIDALNEVAKYKKQGIVLIAREDGKETKFISFGGKDLTNSKATDYLSMFIADHDLSIAHIAMKATALKEMRKSV